MTDDSSLLRQYVRERSQDAFAQIVRQYIDIVYASARRQVHDADLAQDVTQAVFIVLSQKASVVPADRPLSAWLLATTRYYAANARRVREHRGFHERRAAEMARTINEPERDDTDFRELRPLLDEGLSRLGAGERNALVLKYFEKKTLRQVGEALGISEVAATKRVNRAVERLRVFFRRRKAIVGTAAVLALLTAEASEAAPASVAAAVGAGAGAAGTIAKGAIVMMATEKAKLAAVVAVVLILGVGGTVIGMKWLSDANPSRRLAAVTQPVAAERPPATPPGAVATFSDGATVQLVGMTEISDSGARPHDRVMGIVADLLSATPVKSPQMATDRAPIWWGADGSIVPEYSDPSIDRAAASAESDRRALRFIFSARMPNPSDGNVAIDVPGMQGQRHDRVRQEEQERVINLAMTVPRNLERTEVRFGKSRGPWRTDDIAPTSTTQTSHPRGASIIKSIAESENETVVRFVATASTSERETRIVAVNKDGKGVDLLELKAIDGQKEARFPCRLNDVDHVEALSRPYEWVTVPGVVLKPSPDAVRKVQHAFALAHPQIVHDCAQQLFDAIRNADYSDPQNLEDVRYQVNNSRPDWNRWVCDHFKKNPILRVDLGEVGPGKDNYDGWPTIPYSLKLEGGSTISDVLPIYFSPDQNAWIPCEGLDWHLWRPHAFRQPTQLK